MMRDETGIHQMEPTHSNGKSWVKWLVIAVAVVLVGCGAWYAWGYFATKGSIEAAKDQLAGGTNPAATAPVVPGETGDLEQRDVRIEKYPSKLPIEDVTGDQFVGLDTMYPYTYSRTEQLDYAGVKLNNDAQAAAERMRDRIGRQYSNFTGEDGKTTRTIAKPSLDNTPRQIWDQITVGSFQSWEAAQGGNIDEAKKFAAVVNDPEHREYLDEVKGFSINDVTAANSEGVAWNEKPIIASGSYEGITASPSAPLIEFNVNIGGNDSGNRIKAVLRFEQGSKPESNRWVLVTTHVAE